MREHLRLSTGSVHLVACRKVKDESKDKSKADKKKEPSKDGSAGPSRPRVKKVPPPAAPKGDYLAGIDLPSTSDDESDREVVEREEKVFDVKQQVPHPSAWHAAVPLAQPPPSQLLEHGFKFNLAATDFGTPHQVARTHVHVSLSTMCHRKACQHHGN